MTNYHRNEDPAADANEARGENDEHGEEARRADRPSTREAIEATAAAWLAERDDGFTPARGAEFEQWRAADPRHAAAIARLDSAWSALQELRDFRPEAREHPDCDLLARPRRPARRHAFGFTGFGLATAGAACACVCALVLGAAFWFARAPATDAAAAAQHFATTVDGYERVTLADGSLLELNGDSEVRVRFTPELRRVQLVRGEAHFTVAKNPARPFSVEAGAVSVRAVGTAFNVRLGTRDVEVLVTEGKVDVAATEADAKSLRSERKPADAVNALVRAPATSAAATRLEANQRTVIPLALASVPGVTPLVEKIAIEAVREALAWQGPRLVFVDRPLGEVIAQFNRRNHVQLALADVELESLPIGGSFRAENVEAFVRLLKNAGDLVDDRSEPGRIVLRKTATPTAKASPR